MLLLTEPINVLVLQRAVEVNAQSLPCDVDGQTHVLMMRGGRCFETLAEYIDPAIASNEPDQVVTSSLGFGQRVTRHYFGPRQPQLQPSRFQRGQGRFAIQFAVAKASIMAFFESPAFALQLCHSFQLYGAQKPLTVPIVEFLNNAVTPRLSDWNEPGLNTIEQAQPNQRPHRTRMTSAPVEHQLVVDLLVPRQSQAQPCRPERCDCALCITTQQWFYSTAAGAKF